ncbi:hypothetical protein GCM10011585_15070 [Edaphobacter dinghuensis]|uniref:Uncharacterized protein n=1 Tax=Edaphobacter dinghuensis TaxID=1560005 RepID=A0A917M2R6_9BACT|nr:hypothetical protein GCM10011585_15070 [Edaphobacter dinghuensis]
MGKQLLNRCGALIEELDEDQNAITGEVRGLAQLLDLRFRERVFVGLRMQRRVENEEDEGEA